MKYYIFDNDGGNPEVTGIKSGTGQARFEDIFWKKNSHIKEFMFNNNRNDLRFLSGIEPEFSLDLFDLHMDKNAKQTDLIYLSSLFSGFIVSTKFRLLLEQFHLPSHYFYQVTFQQFDKKLNHKKEINDYWYLYFRKETGEKTIDFAKSIYDYSFHNEYLEVGDLDLKVNSFQDYMNIFNRGYPALSTKKIIFNKNFDLELDLWSCRFLSSENYVSERLYDSILKNRITGVKIRDIEIANKKLKIINDYVCEIEFPE